MENIKIGINGETCQPGHVGKTPADDDVTYTLICSSS